MVAIIEPSGAGKSILLRCLNVLEHPDAGVIQLDGLKIEAASVRKKEILALRRSTAMVFQQFNLFKQKTAWKM